MFKQFIDLYLDDLIPGFPCYSSPRFSTTIAASWSGDETRNRNWRHPLRKFRLPEAIRLQEQYEALQDHWLITGGPERCWPFTDPLDFASTALLVPNTVPEITAIDQEIGVGDGSESAFQLVKSYERGGEIYQRPIYLPHEDFVLVALNGLPPSTESPELPGGPYEWTVSRPGGVITFDKPVSAGVTVTAGYIFDVAVRFERDDSFDGIVQSYQVAGFADLDLIEVRPC